MPPKRNKSVTPSAVTPARAASGKHWEASLSTAILEEDDWRVCVSLVQTERAEDEQLIHGLLRAVQKPLRKLFTVLSWENTLEKINELGNPRSRKPKDVPMFFEVTEVAKSLMDAGEEITVHLMAKLIKFQLLIIKNNDIQRRAAERKAEEDNAKRDAASASKDQGGKGAGKGKNAAEVSGPTKNTKLKRRGEEENIIQYIDDEPDDGPQHYILMTGFYKPQLIPALNSLGIQVSNVIKLGLEKEDQSEALIDATAEEKHFSPEDHDPEIDSSKQMRQKELEEFWKQLDQVLNSGSEGSGLYDVAKLTYSVKRHLMPEDTENAEAMMVFAGAIFEGVACLLYDSLDWRRQHRHYLSSMRLIEVPVTSRPNQLSQLHSSIEVLQTPRKKAATEEEPEPESPGLTTEVDMRYYCYLLDRIPAEITSTPLILHCMVEQVVASEQEVTSASVNLEQQSETDKDLIIYMVSSVMSLPMPEEDRKKLMEDFKIQDTPKNKNQKQPLLINHHDERSRRLHQFSTLDGFDPINIEADIVKQSQVWTSLVSGFTESSPDRLCRSQELKHFCTDESMSWFELQRLLRLFVFESMHLTKVDENGCPKRPDPSIPSPWDNPVEYTKHLYWNNRPVNTGHARHYEGTEEQKHGNKVTLSDLQKTLIRQLGHWNFVEIHSAGVFPQVLQSAYKTYRFVDKFYCHRDNAIYIICHNSMSPDRSSKEIWKASLHTDVGFRNYLEYVADSISEWTRQEEEKCQLEREMKEKERTLMQTPSETDLKRDSTVKAPILDTEIYIRKDSLKAWKMEQDRLKGEEELKKTSKERGEKATPKLKEEIKKRPGSLRKNRDIVSKTPSSATLPGEKIRDVPESPEEPTYERKENTFTGYSLNRKLVQVSGEVQSLYPFDGGLIDVEHFHFIQGLKQLKICVKKDGHHFYTHISDRKRERNEIKDIEMIKQGKTDWETEKCVSFYAVLANGIQLSFSHKSPKKTKTHGPIVPSSCTDQQLQVQEEAPKTQSEHVDTSSPALLRLHVSVPNGLILYFDFEDVADGRSSSRSLLINQRYYNTGSRSDISMHTEISRVITCRGTVIKHMKDGSTEILFADGTVSRSPDSDPVCVVVPRSPTEDQESFKEPAVDTKGVKNKKGKANSATNRRDHINPEKSIDIQKQCSFEVTGGTWTTTTRSGLRVASVAGKKIDVKPILTYNTTDPLNETVVVTREDKVLSVLRKDGTVIVDHTDGTRITTYSQQRELQHLISGEKLVRVEKTEFATVIMNCKGSCEVLLGDGTSISATNHGSYKVYPCDGGVLQIDMDGGAVYTSHQSETDTGSYVMNQADVLFHMIDPDGNWFEVNRDGQIAVTASRSEHQTYEETSLQQDAAFQTHPPRLFVVQEDGSALELLRDQDVEDVLHKAYSDSTIAVLTDQLPESKESCCITLLRPCPKDSHWLLSKHEDDIIPTNLKSRKWDSFPSSEKKTPGLPFGTSLNHFLQINNKPDDPTIQAQPVLECPDVLLVRQVMQHPPVTEPLRWKLQENMKLYLEQLLERENQLEKRLPKDPECAQNLSLSDAEVPQVTMDLTPLSGDVASLYTQTVKAGQQSNNLQEKTDEKHTESVNKQKQKSSWENRINRHRQEQQEERRQLIALRHEIVTPYFHPELQEMNAFFTDEQLDLNSLSNHLPPFPSKRKHRGPGFSNSFSGRHRSLSRELKKN